MPAKVPVKNWMSGDPVAVEPSASALEALDRMIERGIRHLPVVDAARCVVGVLSLDDLRAALPFSVSLRGAPDPEERELAREWSVADVMTHAPATVGEDVSLAEAAQCMAQRRIGCLPVVDAAGHLAGLLSETDLLHALATSLWSDEVRERSGSRTELDELAAALRREREAIAARRDAGRELSVRRLAALDRALDHAAQGRLGVCDSCGEAISAARLRALPGTTICVACARATEPGPEPE
jgi:CBS domain-containing protein